MTTTDFDVTDTRILRFLDARAHDLEGIHDEAALIHSLEARFDGRRARRTSSGRPMLVLAAVGLLLVMLIVGGLVGRAPVDDPRPDSEIFRSKTSLGTFEWIAAEAPERIWHEFQIDGQIMGADEAGGWWRLDEDLAWQPTTSPEPGRAHYSTVGDETWAVVGSDGYSVMMGPVSSRQVIAYDWYEGDSAPAVLRHTGDDWVEVPLPSLEPPTAVGLESFGPMLHAVTSADGSSWILPVQYFLEVPWDRLYGIEREGTEAAALADLDGDTVSSIVVAMWDEVSEELELQEEYGRVFASLTVDIVESDPPTVAFRDAESGDLVHIVGASLPGWSADDLVHALRDWGGLDLSFVVHHDGQTTIVRPPWPMSEEWSDQMVVSGGWYYTTSYALGEDYAADAVHLWRSRDGLGWEVVELPTDFPHPVDWALLDAGSGGLGMWVREDRSDDETLWMSTDGTSWTKADLKGLPVSYLTGTHFGWYLDSGVVSADGEAWELIEFPPLPEDPPVGYLHGYLFHGPAEVDGRYVTWFGKLLD